MLLCKLLNCSRNRHANSHIYDWGGAFVRLRPESAVAQLPASNPPKTVCPSCFVIQGSQFYQFVCQGHVKGNA